MVAIGTSPTFPDDRSMVAFGGPDGDFPGLVEEDWFRVADSDVATLCACRLSLLLAVCSPSAAV
jgi:hypothetical protein